MKKLNLDELKEMYVGQTFNYLTVIDVLRNDKSKRIMFRCKCQCGNIVEVLYNTVLSNKSKSCGCYRKEITGNNARQWCENNPDKVALRSEKYRNTLIKNPEILQKRSEQQRQIYISHPEKRIQASNRAKQWYKNNPEKTKDKMAKTNLWWDDNDKVKAATEKMSITRSAMCENNPDYIVKLHKSYEKSKYEIRKNADISLLLNIIHDDYKESLINGELTSESIIRTKYPICNKYAKHKLANVFIFSAEKFKTGHPLLCCECAKVYTSSKYEDEIEEFIKSFYNGEIIRNTRNIISPLELDIYIPNKKVAIEFNGDYFHSENFVEKDYHYNKYIKCKDKEILLISIFESEWNSNKKSIKEYIKDLFDGKENRLSFNDNKTLMNNDYPSPLLNISNEYVVHYFLYKNVKVYACGYSKL